jgi:hypothetical protein
MTPTKTRLTRADLIRKRWLEVKERFNPDLYSVVGLRVPANAGENDAELGGSDFLEFRFVQCGFVNGPNLGSVVCEGILFDLPSRT